ncbi:hypothetical protein [Sphingobacterium griseoflavum]|uniref:hypothetical protein n=1 Tax=Sphingobacterium griseoflavum TaxID=1474952 RepID=UPI0016755925|nr:hypothetical protein [Sphingobacterium griseoflavum]
MDKFFDVHIWLLDHYLDPLLLMPIFLHVYLWERRLLFGKPLHDVLTWRTIVVLCLLVSFIAEWCFPVLNDRFTSDWLDVACYMVGALVFFLFFNRPAQQRLSIKQSDV